MQEVRSYPEILTLTVRAWCSLERRIFQAAWLACGYFSQSHMSRYNDEGADISNLTAENAGKELSDMFDVCGRHPWSCQRCTRYEWQIQDGWVF